MKKIILVFLTSSLFIGCSKDDETTPVPVAAVPTISIFTDVELSQTSTSVTYGRFFSTALGKVIKASEVTASNGADIDMAYVGGSSSFIYFTSPDDTNGNFNIPSATSSSFKNFNSGFAVADFDSMTDDSKLKNLVVINDGEAIGTLNFPVIVTFKNSKGKKGVIKLKSINSNRLLVDIKVQK